MEAPVIASGGWGKAQKKENKLRLLDPWFSELYTPKHIPKVLQGFKWPPSHPTMLMLSGIGHTNPKNASNWLLEASETIKINPKMDSGPQFHPVITPKTHSQGIAKVHVTPRPPYFADAIMCRLNQP